VTDTSEEQREKQLWQSSFTEDGIETDESAEQLRKPLLGRQESLQSNSNAIVETETQPEKQP
jgi:hypothetical protein